jgi:hypothetical protein
MARTKPHEESRKDRYLASLAETAQVLRERALTARQLAEEREFTIMSAHKHLRDLRELGVRFEEHLAYASDLSPHAPKYGPKSKHHRVVFVPPGTLPAPVEG